MMKRWICCAAVWLICAVLNSIPAVAHDLPLDRLMNGFVNIGPHQADFVIRVPLDLLLGVPFPLAGDHYNIAASGPAVGTALKVLASTLQLWEGNIRLEPSAAAGRLAPLSGRSFEDYDQAGAGGGRPLGAGAGMGLLCGFLED